MMTESSRIMRVAASAWGLLLGVLVSATGCAATPTTTASSTEAPVPPPPAATGDDGWIAFSADWDAGDVSLVRPGEASHRIIGSDDDGIVRVCPAFAPGGGSRLAFGEATGDWEAGWTDAALVFADLSAEGEATVVTDVGLDTLTSAPCPIWSPDGRWVAFGAQTAGGEPRLGSPEVWLFDLDSGAITTITDVMVTDIEWAPDSTRLYLADESGVVVYTVGDATRRLLDDTALAQSLTVSPDGDELAVERRRINAADRYDLWLLSADGADQRILVEDYTQMHGLGPVWSPDGTRVVFQRTCDTVPAGSDGQRPCREEHEVVIISMTDGAQTVVPPAQTPDDAVGVATWYPYSVTWSPDSSALLYLGWPTPDDIEAEFEWADGLIVVSPDGAAEPVILYQGAGIHVYTSRPMNVFQSWSAPS